MTGSIASMFYRVYSRVIDQVKKASPAKPADNTQNYDTVGLAALDWIRLLDMAVFLADNSELGKIEAVGERNVVVKRGSVNAKRYYFLKDTLQKEQSGKLHLDMTAGEAELYRKDKVPNPCRYATLGVSHLGYLPRRNEVKF